MTEDSLSNLTPYAAALQQTSVYLQKNDDVRGFLQLIFDLAIQYTGADYGYLLLRKADDPTFQVSFAQDSHGFAQTSSPDAAVQVLNDLALKTGRSVLVSDATGDVRLAGLPDSSVIARAYLIVPMLLAARATGLICLVSKTAGHFDEDQRSFIQMLSTQAALVVDRDRQVQITAEAEIGRSEFISLTTHELRVPLTAIAGYTDMILNGMAGPMTERQETFLGTIRRNVDRMRILIDTLGEMNRIDGGRRKFELRAHDPSEILEAAILALEKDIAGRYQELVVDVQPSLPLVWVDRSAVSAVLTALIDNASRYSPAEAIISVQLSFSGAVARFEVIDLGAGISSQDQDRVFTPFFRSDNPVIREHIGWGLALTHGKKVIETLGGTIGFESTLGQGSIFFFTIPLAAANIKPS